MKIAVNLSTSPVQNERRALAWSIPLGLGAVAVLVYFSFSIVHDLSNSRKYQRSLVELQSQEGRWNEKEKSLKQDLSRPQYLETFREAKYVNSLIGQKDFSLEELIQKVTRLLPPAVRLDDFSYTPASSDSIVRLTVVGKTQESVETFLNNLEESADFEDVIVMSASHAGVGGGAAPSAACTAVYVRNTAP